MTETIDTPSCPECGFDELEVSKSVENNEVQHDGWYCPDCEATFEDDTVLEWNSLSFPLWVEMESYNDNYQLLDSLCYQHNVHRDVVPNKRAMKYSVFTVWYKIEGNGGVNGPYASRNGEEL